MMFSCSRHAIYYSGDAKPYIVDLALAILLFLVLASFRDRPRLEFEKKVALAALGTLGIGLSFPSIFILSGVELVGWLQQPSLQKWRDRIRDRLPIYGVWLAAFGAVYVVAIAPTLANDALTSSWGDRYPSSPWDVVWLVDSLGRFFYRPMGFKFYVDGLAILAFVIGLVSFWRRDRQTFFLLNAPMAATLGASFLQSYPFRERLILFLVPFATVILAEGMTRAAIAVGNRHWLLRGSGIALCGILLLAPVHRTARLAFAPQAEFVQHLRPLLDSARENWKSGDRVVVLAPARAQFRYYNRRYRFASYRYLSQPIPQDAGDLRGESGEAYRQAISELGEGRVWFVLTRREANVEAALLADLDRFGERLDVFRERDALVCLYDLEGASPTASPPE